jgi:hypothetical protein
MGWGSDVPQGEGGRQARTSSSELRIEDDVGQWHHPKAAGADDRQDESHALNTPRDTSQ